MPVSQASPLTDAAAAALAQVKAVEAARAASLPNQGKPTDGMGKDTFLKLLVAQLKYQNPMEPADSSQFMAQTAQFSMVERLESMEKATTELLASERSRAATSLLGNQITWKDGGGVEKTGVVTGVRMGADGSTLVVGDKDVPYASVTKVTTAPAPTAPASTPTPAPEAPAAADPSAEAPTVEDTPPVDPTSEPAPTA